MKVALITDQHFGVRGDSIQFHEFFSEFYKNFFFPYLDEHNISTIVELGDIFDRRKYINFDTLSRCKDYWFNEIQKRDIKLHCIVGNHDIYFKNTNRVNAPHLLLQEYAFEVYEEPTEVEIGDVKVLMLPWINNQNYEDSMNVVRNTNASIVWGHLEFQGFEMYRGAMNDHGLSHRDFTKFDMVCSGHFHHKSSKDNIHYLGAPYEMTWSDYDDARGFHIFDTETRELEYVKNPYTMFHKVFYDDSELNQEQLLNVDFSSLTDKHVKVIVKTKNNPYVFDLYIDKLNAAAPAHMQVVEDNFNLDISDDNDIINEAEDTVTIIKNYIGNLNLSEPKPMENLFYDLYHEALSAD